MHLSDTELVTQVTQGLKHMGYQNFEIQDSKVIRLPQSYPVYHPGYEQELSKTLEWLDSLANFRTIGRQGAFNYIGTLDCMDIGYGAARWFAQGAKPTEWPQERTRTSHYPVLD
jgi:protoporphyrinogen oxidase